MKYNVDFWNNYADENDSKFNEGFSKFVRDLAFSLKTKTILEVGCSTGNDVRSFSSDFTVYGIDLNGHALEKAKQKLPAFNFKKASATEIPFENSSIDFVFTHKLLNYRLCLVHFVLEIFCFVDCLMDKILLYDFHKFRIVPFMEFREGSS